MRPVYDVLPVGVVCECGQQLFELVGRLENDPNINCCVCNTLVNIDAAELKEKVYRVKKEFDELTSSMRWLSQ
jgi:hypothetical protein